MSPFGHGHLATIELLSCPFWLQNCTPELDSRLRRSFKAVYQPVPLVTIVQHQTQDALIKSLLSLKHRGITKENITQFSKLPSKVGSFTERLIALLIMCRRLPLSPAKASIKHGLSKFKTRQIYVLNNPSPGESSIKNLCRRAAKSIFTLPTSQRLLFCCSSLSPIMPGSV